MGAAAAWTVSARYGIVVAHQGAGADSVFKTMWKMPAKLLRRSPSEDVAATEASVDDQIAAGSLEDMIKTADGLGDAGGDDLVIECVGRDRPITWAEIQGLRSATTFPAGP